MDLFRAKDIFLLRDDGFGMTIDDFIDRWLVLGTDSKLDDIRGDQINHPAGKELRPVLGEKGIGRLSIAAIGKQVLILSRAKREDDLKNIVACFIHWGLFEIPGINLEQIEIPVCEFDHIPEEEEILKLKDDLLRLVFQLRKQKFLLKFEARNLYDDICGFNVSCINLLTECPTTMSLENHEGTHFFISKIDATLNSLLNQESSDDSSKMEKFLVGFTSSFSPNHPKVNIQTAFRDHGDDIKEIIDQDAFFTTEDFSKADHHFLGSFDEYGQFCGSVTIYNKHTMQHKIPWGGNQYKKTMCGPIEIEVAYLQGNLRQSSLDPISYAMLKTKTDKFGGLYIYRDGIRILPYGNADFDFLDIEKNRSKSASYYFFSYRRIMGVVNITKKENSKLIEKAGREGLIENLAYKQMRDILKNFFSQLAADFFRLSKDGENGVYTEYWNSVRMEKEKTYRALEKRNAMVKTRKDKHILEINTFFNRKEDSFWNKQITQIFIDSEEELRKLSLYNNPENAGAKLLEIEQTARNSIMTLKETMIIKSPRGFALSRESRENWEAYLESRDNMISTIIVPAEEKLVGMISSFREKLNIEINNRIRIQNAVNIVAQDASKITRQKRSSAQTATSELTLKVKNLTQELMERVELRIRESQQAFSSLSSTDITDEDVQKLIREYESPINFEKEYATDILENIIAQIDSIYWDKDQDGNIITSQTISDSLEEEVENLRVRAESDSELIQLGLAVNIVHHELLASVNGFRHAIDDLKRQSDIYSSVKPLYKTLHANYVHLDQYLSLLTPFSRRMYKTKEVIKAEEIFYFINDVFQGKMKRHNIVIKRTKGFSSLSILSYRSILYPVFTNIIDNAIYWLKQKESDEPRIIRLHASSDGILYISNNGTSVNILDYQRIFELGFSRKVNGRGMGLAISKEVLNSIGYDIRLCSPRPEMSVSFEIYPKKQTEGLKE